MAAVEASALTERAMGADGWICGDWRFGGDAIDLLDVQNGKTSFDKRW